MFGFAADTPERRRPPVRCRSLCRSAGARRLHRPAAARRRRHRLPAAAAARRSARDLGRGHRARRDADEGARFASRRSMRDVSERKRLEDQARDLYHQLLQAEKLAALGQTISGVAHELNNPLATILTWAERLSQRSGRRADQARPRDDPQRVGARREDRPQPADLRAQAAHDAGDGRRQPDRARDARAALATSRRSPTSRIIEALAAGLPLVFADPHQFQQVLLNLIINAEQAMLGANGRGTLILRSWHDLDGDAVDPRSERRRARACRRTCSRASSIRSSRRRKSARAPASD